MKAVAVFPKAREVRVIQEDEPIIRHPHQVKVRMLEVGICGTDKEICAFEYGTPPPATEYLILGHESLGQVVETGTAVQSPQVGDLVVLTVRRPCHHAECRPCRSGNQDFCSTGKFTERGIKERHGYMAEYVVEEAQYLHIVPPELRDVAVLTEPLTIAAKALLQTVTLLQRLPWFTPRQLHQPRDRTYHALVLGAGAVGLLGAMALSNLGFETHVYDRAAAPNPKSELVQAIGGEYVCESTTSEFEHLVGEVAVVYEATGASDLAFRAMRYLGPNGLFIWTGVPALGAAKHIDTDAIMRHAVLKNQLILGTVSSGDAGYVAALQALASFTQRWPEVVQALITGRHPLDEAPTLLRRRGTGIKDVITF